MEEQVVVVYGIHTSVLQNLTDVLMKFLRHLERVVELVHEQFLLRCQLIRMRRVDSREGVALQLILLAVKHDGALIVVDIVEQQTVLHLPSRVALDDGSLLLELYDGNGLVHESSQTMCLLVKTCRVCRRDLRTEFLAGIVAVCLHGEGGKRHKIDAITLFQSGEVGIT